MKKALSLLISIHCFIYVLAQEPTLINRPSSIPSEYKIELKQEYEKSLKMSLDAGLSEKNSAYVANILASTKYNSVMSGDIYYDWAKAEKYLNDILELLLKQVDVTLPYKPKVYLCLDASFNASAIHDGALFFNIGCFEYLENEAEIAAILSHELAHYSKNHLIKSLKDEFETDYSAIKGVKNRYRLKLTHFSKSRVMETEADSIGFNYFVNSGFDSDAFLSVEKKFDDYNKAFKRFGYVVNPNPQFATHPSGEKRIAHAEKRLKGLTDKTGKKFVIDETTFKEIKKQSETEIIKILLDNAEYEICMEKCFANYLKDTTDNYALLNLLESIRKYSYDNRSQNASFIASFYYYNAAAFTVPLINFDISSIWKKQLHNIFPGIEKPETIIQDKFLWEKPYKIETNKKAFNYFFEKAKSRGLSESYLSAGLYYWASGLSKNGKNYITEYLALPDIKHKEYASFLMNKDKSELEDKKTLIVVTWYDLKEYHNKIEVSGYCYYDSLHTKLIELCKSNVDEEKYEVISSEKLIKENIQLEIPLLMMEQIIAYSMPERVTNGNEINNSAKNILLYDPIYYNTFFASKKYGKVFFVEIIDEVTIDVLPEKHLSSFSDVEIKKRLVDKYVLKPSLAYDLTKTSTKYSINKIDLY